MENKIKIITIVGARPQFIKSACVSRKINELNRSNNDIIEEIIIHTGQHFDYGMSEIFFKDLGIPEPKYNLAISSLSQGAMVGRMIEDLEKILIDEIPDIVLIYGDTNSTLAGSIAATKLHIPVAHVEAGLRSFNNKMPEEVNRIIADRISSLLFAPSEVAIRNLETEGFSNLNCTVIKSGDIMLDSLVYNKKLEIKPDIKIPEKFILATLHRPETTNSFENLNTCIEIFKNKCLIPVLLILHPGTKEKIKKNKIDIKSNNLKVIPPLSYHEMLYLLNRCKLVATDSGGLQKEAFWYNKYCVTLRNESEWTELIDNDFNIVSGYEKESIVSAINTLLMKKPFDSKDHKFYGKGNSADIIMKYILNFVKTKRNKE